MSFNEYKQIYNVLLAKIPCNFLIFGTGNDSKLWIKVNEKGNTVFLEDREDWFKVAKEESPSIRVFKVEYNTNTYEGMGLLKKFKLGEDTLSMELPVEVVDTKWDIILVDGPRGSRFKSRTAPGRMKSIYTAYKLTHEKDNYPVVFIHDEQRFIENKYANVFFGKTYKKIDVLRQYQL